MSDETGGGPPPEDEAAAFAREFGAGAAEPDRAVPVVRPAEGAVARESATPPALRSPPPPKLQEPEELASMSLLEHLEELRKRLLWSFATLGVVFCACWYFCEPIFHFLAVPIYRYLPPGQKLVMLSVSDGFFLYMKVALIAAVFISSPVLLFHIWRFIQPGLYRRERRYALGFVLFGTVLFLSGGAFAYYVAFPFAVQFLLDFGKEFTPAITGPSYLRFLMTVILGLGLMFELPVVIIFVTRVGLVTPGFLMRYFRHAVVIIFVIAAIITPTPDVFNLCLFAVPTLVLYLLGVGLAALFGLMRRREQARRLAEAGASAS